MFTVIDATLRLPLTEYGAWLATNILIDKADPAALYQL
jgi:hypothetical protein